MTFIATVSAALALGTTISASRFERGAREVLRRWGPLIAEECKTLSPGYVAARVWIETRGNPNVRHSSTGETGLLQVWPSTARRYGYAEPPTDPRLNLRIGCAFWVDRAKALWRRHGHRWSSDEDTDFWATAWLVQSIGPGAVDALIAASAPPDGDVIGGILRWIRGDHQRFAQLRGRFGTQPIETVATRVARNANAITGAERVSPVLGSLHRPVSEVSMSTGRLIALGLAAGAAGVAAYLAVLRFSNK